MDPSPRSSSGSNDSDEIRRWTRQIGQLRVRALKLLRVRNLDTAADSATLLDEVFATCNSLVQELAGTQLRCDRLRAELQAGAAQHADVIQRMPVACVTTDREGTIVDANRSAVALLNTSAKYLRGRLLLHFAEDRELFGTVWKEALRNHEHTAATIAVRPREHAARPLEVVIVPETSSDSPFWLCFLAALPAAPARRAAHRRTASGRVPPSPSQMGQGEDLAT